MEQTATMTQRQSSVFPMTIIGILFFIFGFVTWLNGSLIPFLKIICQLNEFQALFVTFAFYIAYTVMALPMSYVLKHTGYKKGMALGLAIMAVGALLHIPAALSANFAVFLIALFVLASGLTILQTASNPYVVNIGPSESAAMRISIMGLINKSAGVLVPILFATWVLAGFEHFDAEHLANLTDSERQQQIVLMSAQLIKPYLMMAVALVLLIALVLLSGLPELEQQSNAQDQTHDDKSSIWHFPQVVLGALALFAYVGVEVMAGDTIGLYGSNLKVSNFASLTSYTMVFMVIGYIIGVLAIPRYLSQAMALKLSGVAGMLCVFGIVFGSTTQIDISQLLWGWSSIPTIPNTVFFVALMGLAHALVWPAVWPLALSGVGKYTAQASALLIMGIAGGAIIPLLFGKLAHASGNIQAAYWVALPCYGFILFYAIKGHKIRRWR